MEKDINSSWYAAPTKIWPIVLETNNTDCTFLGDQNKCWHSENKEKLCFKKNCPLFIKTLTFYPDGLCGCTTKGCYYYNGSCLCANCLEWEIKGFG
jgi:hypothetical protein